MGEVVNLADRRYLKQLAEEESRAEAQRETERSKRSHPAGSRRRSRIEEAE